MNKKLILSCVYGVFALTMVGCGTGQSSTINALSKQLDRTTNTVSSISNSALYSFSPFASQQYYSGKVSNTNTTTAPTYHGYVGSQIYKVQSAATEQEQLKNAILSQTAIIKNSFKGLKLSKNQMRALNDLTSNITKYTNSINNTKSDVNNTIRQIRRVNKPNSYNNDELGAHLQTLNSHMDARLAYYRNILSALDQVQNVIACKDCADAKQNSGSTTNNGMTPNIDTYAGNGTQNVSYKNTSTYDNGRNLPHYVNRPNGYGANNGYYGPNGYGNGYYGANNGYGANGYGYGISRFNPSRNTDTYGPRGRNIDTYRTMPNTNNGYVYNYNNGVAQVTTQAEKDESKDKTEQKVENDNTQQKVENNTQKVENNNLKTENDDKKEVVRHTIMPRKQQIVRTQSALDVNKNIEKLIKNK